MDSDLTRVELNRLADALGRPDDEDRAQWLDLMVGALAEWTDEQVGYAADEAAARFDGEGFPTDVDLRETFTVEAPTAETTADEEAANWKAWMGRVRALVARDGPKSEPPDGPVPRFDNKIGSVGASCPTCGWLRSESLGGETRGKHRQCGRCGALFSSSQDEFEACRYVREMVINPTDPRYWWMWLHLEKTDPGLPPDQRRFVEVVAEADDERRRRVIRAPTTVRK